jgi:hypothetical protein
MPTCPIQPTARGACPCQTEDPLQEHDVGERRSDLIRPEHRDDRDREEDELGCRKDNQQARVRAHRGREARTRETRRGGAIRAEPT